MRKGLIGISLALLAAGSLGVAGPAAAWVGDPGDPFCQGEVLRAYETPLEGLPAVRESPSASRPSWMPLRLSLRRESLRLVISGKPISYRLALSGVKYGDLRLDWVVESDLVRIDRDGRSLKVAKRSVERIAQLAPGGKRSLGFARSPSPGLYRYDISFAKNGKRLARYRDYYRVVRRSTDVRLTLNGTSFRPGEQILGKVENYGTSSLFYGLGFGLERYDGATWLPVSLSELFGRPYAFLLIGLNLDPGRSDDCSSGLTVPESMSPGLYRMVKSVEERGPSSLRGEMQTTIMAEFAIAPPA